MLDKGYKFDTGCLVFDEGNAASTTDGLQVGFVPRNSVRDAGKAIFTVGGFVYGNCN